MLASTIPAAHQRIAICPSRQRLTLREWSRLIEIIDSTALVERSVLALTALAKELDKTHPGAAASCREGMAETLTVLHLDVPLPTLRSQARDRHSSSTRPGTTSMRSPLTASNPTSVSKVAARSGERSWRAAAMRAAMSASEYR